MGRRLDASMAELEIDGLRPYREGTSASRIHWPTVARRGEMLERRLVAELDSAPLIVLDPSGEDEEGLDKAVRAAGSLCVHLGHAGGCAILLPGERRPVEIGHDLAGWATVHARLALVESGPPPLSRRTGPARRRRHLGYRGRRRRRSARAGAHAGRRAHRRLADSAGAWPGAVRSRRLHRQPGRTRAAWGGRVSGSAATAVAGVRPAQLPAAVRVALVRLTVFAALGLFAAAHWVDAGVVAAGRAHGPGRAGGHRHGGG